MVAENDQRKQLGQSMAYAEEAFLAVIDEEGVDHNSIIELANEDSR